MTFEDAVDLVAHQSVNEQGRHLTVADIATRIGKSENYLAKATSKHYAEKPLRGELIVPLTLATNNYAIVEHICEAVGGVFFKLPKVDAANRDVLEHAGRLATEFGDVMTSAATALADRRVTPDEARSFRAEVLEQVAVALQMADLMDAKAGLAPGRAVDRKEA